LEPLLTLCLRIPRGFYVLKNLESAAYAITPSFVIVPLKGLALVKAAEDSFKSFTGKRGIVNEN
jgi:hypothetical protein